MARTRNLKPGFFKNEDLAACQPLTRLLFAGLWCLADREGKLEDRPMRIKADVLPYDAVDVHAMLAELAEKEFIQRYTAEGRRVIRIPNFPRHQRPHPKEPPSSLPDPQGLKESRGKKRPDHGRPCTDHGEPCFSTAGCANSLTVLQSHSLTLSQSLPPPTPPGGGGGAGGALALAERAHFETDRRFAQFWALYPKKAGEPAARTAWFGLALDDELFAKVMAGLERHLRCPQWLKEGGRYVPKPANWLAQRGWEDQIVAAARAETADERIERVRRESQ